MLQQSQLQQSTAAIAGYSCSDLSESEIIENFSHAMQTAGIKPPVKIIADGALHRFGTNDKRSDKAGFYILYTDGIPAGMFGDWRTGFKQKWRIDLGRKLTPAEQKQHSQRVSEMQRQREIEVQKANEEAAKRAKDILENAEPADETHQYLNAKQVKPHGTKVLRDGRLLVPMVDIDGRLWNVEKITIDGKQKKGLFGGKRSGCFYPIGTIESEQIVCICEGFATGASVYETTGLSVIVSFNAGNLKAVAQAFHHRYQGIQIVICADDDYETTGNPGRTKAKEAAQAIGALVAIPEFGPNRPKNAKDFNDLAIYSGANAIQSIFTKLLEGKVSQVSKVQANKDSISTDTLVNKIRESEVSEIPKQDERPCFRVIEKWLEHGDMKYRPGVWYFGIKQSKEAPLLTQAWICSPLYIDAITCDAKGNNFGRLLRFRTSLNQWRTWSMPMHLLKGSGDELRGDLLNMGLEIDQQNRFKLGEYLQYQPPKRRITCVTQTGWVGDCFVLPDAIFGANAANYVFQSESSVNAEFTQGGTFEGWQKTIAAMTINNTLLITAISSAFSGALLKLCNAESGGLHFYGKSSSGKSSMTDAACSVWGGRDYRRSWKATANGLEGIAQLFNDGLLALDEIGECNPNDVGEIVYMLGNGRGKQRAGRAGNARSVAFWRSFVLSNGEQTVQTIMSAGGHRIKAGQEVRLLNIPCDKKYGAFDDLRGKSDGSAFADTIKTAADKHYGHAGKAYLERLTREKRDIGELYRMFKQLPQFSTEGSGQQARAAARFALIALAGELAIEYGITKWKQGTSIEAAATCFNSWKASRGHAGDSEIQQVIGAVKSFIERFKDGRFTCSNASNNMRVNDRAGYWEDIEDNRIYLFNSSAMREALKGYDFKQALNILEQAKVLPPAGADGKRATFRRIHGEGGRYYHVNSHRLEIANVD